MQSQSDEFINASNDYFKRLNGVNLLLLKEHTLLLEKKQYEEEIVEVDALIAQFESGQTDLGLAAEAEFDWLQKEIRKNKKEIGQLKSKLQPKDSMISELNSLIEMRNKYQKLIDTTYQNSIQQKLSMIRGKVDDLKKKIKQINKDILSYEQEHAQLIDEYSFQIKTYECYKEKNRQLAQEIEQLKQQRRK